MRRLDAIESGARAIAHPVGDVVVGEHAVTAEQARERNVEAANAAT